MFTSMLPWFAMTLLVGIVLGLVAGIVLASTLVKGHYSHIIGQQQSRPLMQQASNDYPYDERRMYPRR